MRTYPDVERLREYLDYNPLSGKLHWRKAKGYKILPGMEVGGVNTIGYVQMGFDGMKLLAHRVIWLMVYGELIPDIDHKDGDKSNNRIDNLRSATRVQQNGNSTLAKHNTSGHKGVSFRKDRKKWRAFISINDKFVHLGYFDNQSDAIKRYSEAAIEHFGQDFVCLHKRTQ